MANVMPPATTAIMGALPREKAGVGSAVNNTLRQVGGAMGVAVLGSILASSYRNQITPHLSPLPGPARQAASESVGATVGVLERLPASVPVSVKTDIQNSAFNAFVHSMHVTATFSTLFALASTFVVFRFLPKRATNVEADRVIAPDSTEAAEASVG